MSSNSSDRPLGQRFSQLYLKSDNLVQDSNRARRRVAALLTSLHRKDIEGLEGALPHELGVDPVWDVAGVD